MFKFYVTNDDQLDDIIITEDTSLHMNLENSIKDINIDVMKDMCLEVFEIGVGTKNNIRYTIRENASVIINKLSKDNSDTTLIVLEGDNSEVQYNFSNLNSSSSNVQLKVGNDGKGTITKIHNHIIRFTNNEFGYIIKHDLEKTTKDCTYEIDNKIINLSNDSKNPVDFIEEKINENDRLGYVKDFLLSNMNLNGREKEDYENFVEDNFN